MDAEMIEKVARAIDPVAWGFIDRARRYEAESGEKHPALLLTLTSQLAQAERAIDALSATPQAESALRDLHAVVIEQNRLGASWHPEVFGRLMTALANAKHVLEATPQADASARGYVDDDRKRIASGMQSMRDRLGGFLAKTYGDAFDGDIDTMLDAINLLKAIKISPATPQAAPLDALKAAAKYGWEHPRWDLDAVLIGVEERFAATPQAAQVPEDAVTRLAIYLAKKDGHDPHALLWGEPRVEAWVRYKADASDYLAAAQAQGDY